jgi:hypothetical protein
MGQGFRKADESLCYWWQCREGREVLYNGVKPFMQDICFIQSQQIITQNMPITWTSGSYTYWYNELDKAHNLTVAIRCVYLINTGYMLQTQQSIKQNMHVLGKCCVCVVKNNNSLHKIWIYCVINCCVWLKHISCMN